MDDAHAADRELKRIEVVTGPGGVLWGANSFLGIVNLISKDADDVNGLELSAGYGDGRGNTQDTKSYLLFGKSFWNGRLKLFQHASFESFVGATYTEPQAFSVAAPPNPGGTAQFGPTTLAVPTRSWLAIVDGKYSLGPVRSRTCCRSATSTLRAASPEGPPRPAAGSTSTIAGRWSSTTTAISTTSCT